MLPITCFVMFLHVNYLMLFQQRVFSLCSAPFAHFQKIGLAFIQGYKHLDKFKLHVSDLMLVTIKHVYLYSCIVDLRFQGECLAVRFFLRRVR